MQELIQELEEIRQRAQEDLQRVTVLEKEIADKEKKISLALEHFSEKVGDLVEERKFIEFFRKPYATIPFGKNKALVAVPKFVKNFQVGWLWKETDSFYIYQLDQYSAWLGEVPKELLSEINFKKEFEATVEGDRIYFSPEYKDAIKKRLSGWGNQFITDVTDSEARIIRGHVFDVLAETIKSGCLPFKQTPVSQEDTRPPESKIVLRDYQKEASKKFMETGALGVFHPTGAGKSFIALHLIDVLKGRKLIVVPTKTLVEQWRYYVETFVPHAKNEVQITTYQGWRSSGDEYMLCIYDECQRLPADTFSRLAVINTKYRIGLSASPHREDGRENYIFALTGYPIGLNWREYMETVGRKYHPIFVHVVATRPGKLRKLGELLDVNKKTFIYCDTIELGKEIAKQFSVPYIYGASTNRLQEVRDHRVLVVSRVMDLGVSVKDLQRIIEVDFLFGSRQQELQRTGRLMHSEATGIRHDIIMTEAEASQYGKRLWALSEKGFTVKIAS